MKPCLQAAPLIPQLYTEISSVPGTTGSWGGAVGEADVAHLSRSSLVFRVEIKEQHDLI